MRISPVPSAGAVANRRLLVYILVAVAIVMFLFVGLDRGAGAGPSLHVASDTLHGGAIMPRLGNETLKAELGRSAWKVLHTMMARFPDQPTLDEQTALQSYIHLFARLYPCGECALHFRQILARYPPQVRTRSAAAVWACHVHNEVNASLGKPAFDCAQIGDFYDCGCGDDDSHKHGASGSDDGELKLERDDQMAGG